MPTDAVNEMVLLKQSWLAFRKRAESFGTECGPAPAIDAPLAESDKTELSNHLQKKHGYIIPSDMMLEIACWVNWIGSCAQGRGR